MSLKKLFTALVMTVLTANLGFGVVDDEVSSILITHDGHVEFSLPATSSSSVATLVGVIGETISLKIYITSTDNGSQTYYLRWLNPGTTALNNEVIASQTLEFTKVTVSVASETLSFAGTFTPPDAGDYEFEVVDPSGSTIGGDLDEFTITVKDLEIGELTYASMRTPTDGETLSVLQSITLSANVGPSILREYVSVDYYVNGYKVNETPVTYGDGGEFFSYVWQDPYIGENVEFQAIAHMANGKSIETDTVEADLTGYGSPPIVSISAPPGDSWVVGSEAQFTVQASDSGGLVQQIDLYVNGTVVDTITEAYAASPWTFDFKFPSSGPYDVWAIAEFSTGNRAISNILNYDLKLGSAPYVYLISPIPGMQFLPGSQLPILASAWDPNSLIHQLKYYVNDTLIETATRQIDGTFDPDPITFTYNFPFAGMYRIYVQATDESGVISQSDVVQVAVKDLNSKIPTVVMTHPLPVGGGDTVNDVSVGSQMYLNAKATDKDGTVTKVNFYINSQIVGSSSTDYEDTFASYFAPTTAGNYVMFAEAIDNSGNKMHSPPLLLNVYALEAQLPKVEILPLPDRYTEFDAGSEITVSAKVDGGLVEISQVNFYIDGVLVDAQDEANEGDTTVYTASFIVSEPGYHLISARVIEIDPVGLTTDNWTIADPVGIKVNAASGNRAFVSRVYLNIVGAAPSQTVLDNAVYALDAGQKTQAQYVYELMEADSFLNTKYALMARYLLTGEWPTRAVMISDISTVATSLSQLVTTHLPTFQSKYWSNQRIPDGFSTNTEFKNFFKALFNQKYGQDPTTAQSDRGIMQLKVYFVEDFIAEFVRDIDATAFGSGTISTILAIPNPPNSLLEDRAYTASLYCNLLKVQPTVSEVEALRTQTKIQQIQTILSDSRF